MYVDDIILTGDDLDEISALKNFLHDQFKIKDLRLLHYFLGIKVFYYDSGVLLHQKRFISNLLSEFHCTDVFPVASPLALTIKLHSSLGDLLPRPDTYRCIIVPPTPRVSHMDVAFHVLRYLKGTSEFGVHLNNSPAMSLVGCCDIDWAACPDSRRSVTGFCVFLGGSLLR
ncbi:uncharacterized mitochondrial protein AtMg00810-like [Lycium barbarum]|uniref:uncharacterized mitochondrial protein AtMg00810-like n=1 Tax=Lycium barbarum TaxID=112863 RepID=UPI00293E4D04|nr:uncharacterized mitochondrial protein AtMg00810-like [Lycium barbarum]